MEWGWNPDTFTALGTVGASLAALVALLISLAQARRARAERSALLAEALALTCTVLDRTTPGSISCELRVLNQGTMPARIGTVVVVVSQRSRYAVPDLQASWRELFKYQFGRAHISDDPFPDSTGYDITAQSGYLISGRFWRNVWPAIVDPGQSVTLQFELLGKIKSPFERYLGPSFTDANGRDWTRRIDGRLVKGVGLTPWEVRRNLRRL